MTSANQAGIDPKDQAEGDSVGVNNPWKEPD